MHTSTFRVLFLLALAGASHAQQSRQSTFTSGTEGWTHAGAAAFFAAIAGGNPGGYLHIDNSEGPVTFVFAPPAFHGDLRVFDGGTLSFDGNMLGIGGNPWTSAGQDYGHLQITGGAGTRTVDLLPAPGQPTQGAWTTYQVNFDAATFGGTQETWLAILSNVTEIRLSVEAMFGSEVQGLDNFKLTTRVDAPWSEYWNGSGVNTAILRNTSASAPAPRPSVNAPVIGKNWTLELDCNPAGAIGGTAYFRLGFGPRITPFGTPFGEMLVPLGAGAGKNFVVALPADRLAKLPPQLIPNSTLLIGSEYVAQGRCPGLVLPYLSNALYEIVGQ